MRRATARRGQIAEINVVPYIDVMLVLLVIFMITTPLLTQGVKVNLPKAKAEAITSSKQLPIIVTVDKKGNFYLNLAQNPRVPLAEQALATQVEAYLQLAKRGGIQRQVLVRADKSVNYGQVVRAMALLQRAGAPTVGLLTDNTNTGQHA